MMDLDRPYSGHVQLILLTMLLLNLPSFLCETPRNVALNKTATQSSTFDGTDRFANPPLTYRASAGLAVDGAPTKSYFDRTCAVTEWLNGCTINTWWQVDLGGLYDVFNVTIYQRGEGERGINNYGPLVVRVGDRVKRLENRTRYSDRPVVPIPLSPPVTASTVNISILGCGILHLCEVEVYGVKHVNECASNPCLNKGSCTDGFNTYTCRCVPGFTGSRCETDIDECQTAPCRNGAVCTDGSNAYTCTCRPGYIGTDCDTACRGGTFGPGCSGTCSPHCLESSDRGSQHCDHVTGVCLLQTGCKDGFQGSTCSTKQQPCPAERYAEGVGTGLGVGLGTSLLLALGIFALLRSRNRGNSSSERAPADGIPMSPGQPAAAGGQTQRVSAAQEVGFYESLDDATKSHEPPNPYEEL